MKHMRQLQFGEVLNRLITIKRMVADTKDALPRHAAELRREACEEIDDLIGDLRRAL